MTKEEKLTFYKYEITYLKELIKQADEVHKVIGGKGKSDLRDWEIILDKKLGILLDNWEKYTDKGMTFEFKKDA